MIEPTGGSVISHGSRHLINGKSSAGYKPMLKIIENLRLQAMFLGLHGDDLELAIENTLEKLNEIGGRTGKLIVCLGPCISKKNYEVKEDFYLKFKEKSKENDSFFSRKSDNNFNFDLRGFVNKKFRDLGVVEIENVFIDTFAINNNYFSHRRAKKLGENDYGRCISVIKKTSSQN